MTREKMIICIAGPTASGKSGLALALARHIGADIINADALQVYANWRILTSRPPESDLQIAPHRLYGHVARETTYSVGAWLRDIAPLLAAPGPHIIVGGTGLYFTALTNGLAQVPEVPGDIRLEGDALRRSAGAEGFLSYLAPHDPVILTRIDTQNPMRLQRAWEVHRATGRALSDWQDQTGPPLVPPQDALRLKLMAPPDWLTPRIETRFDQMIDEGALEECRANLQGWDPERPSSRALGGPEMIRYLQGQMTLEAAIEQGKIATRQYAKRQRTWFRSRMADWQEIEASKLDQATVNRIISMT
ncbi:tRNA (adenosine(37)-N6)-dimethylallyltransferase MiaA [Halovulum sp. GXIMD14793]